MPELKIQPFEAFVLHTDARRLVPNTSHNNKPEKRGCSTLSTDRDTLPRLCGIKHKASAGGEFNLVLEQATPGGSLSWGPETTPPKRKRVGNKKGGYVKYHESVQQNKPEPYGKPPVWSDKRQGLCETLPYYKAYQSGAYITDGIVRALMCDKEVGPRDKFDEEIIITRV
jgi:hypothetical protein